MDRNFLMILGLIDSIAFGLRMLPAVAPISLSMGVGVMVRVFVLHPPNSDLFLWPTCPRFLQPVTGAFLAL